MFVEARSTLDRVQWREGLWYGHTIEKIKPQDMCGTENKHVAMCAITTPGWTEARDRLEHSRQRKTDTSVQSHRTKQSGHTIQIHHAPVFVEDVTSPLVLDDGIICPCMCIGICIGA